MVQAASRQIHSIPFMAEASLSQINDVQAGLTTTQRELEGEIAELQAQLRESQDPARMQLIQEMISVRPYFLYYRFEINGPAR
jgi:hypothetical protein